MDSVRTLGLRSRWETAGAWLTTEGDPVDAVGDRVTASTAAGGTRWATAWLQARLPGGAPVDTVGIRRSSGVSRARPSMPVLPSTICCCGWPMRLANPIGLKKICETNAVRNPFKPGYYFSVYLGNRVCKVGRGKAAKFCIATLMQLQLRSTNMATQKLSAYVPMYL